MAMTYRCIVSVLARDAKSHSALCRWLGVSTFLWYECAGGKSFAKDFASKEEAVRGRAALLATVDDSVEVVESKIEPLSA